MDIENDKPKIRAVEAIPLDMEDKRMIVLRDGSGVTDTQLVLSPTAFFVVTLFDGTNTVRDMQAAYARKVGEILPSEKIVEIVSKLDAALLLDGPRFETHYQGLVDAFHASGVRPSTLAGQAYEADPTMLDEQLAAFFAPPEEGAAPPAVKREAPLPGLIAPHIDLARGSASYAAAWSVAADGPAPDAVIILGTAHQGAGPNLFIAARKAFETPLGACPLDGELMDAIASRTGDSIFEDEFVHANEHSVEFQVLFVQHVFGPKVPIIPLVACSFHEFVMSGKDPIGDERVGGFVQALREAIAETGRRVLFVASADLAHVGPKFGDSMAANDLLVDAVRRSDMELLRHAGAMDADAFFRAIAKQGDRTRVCGFPSIYTLLKFLEGTGVRGMLRKYDTTVDPSGSAVTFAGMTFE